MLHHIDIRIPPHANPHADRQVVYEVYLNNRKHGELTLAGAGYTGYLPTYEGNPVSIGTRGIAEWRREAMLINRRAKELLSALDRRTQNGIAASYAISEIVQRARDVQAEFFDEMGLLPGNIASLSDEEKVHLQKAYGEWLGTTGKLTFDAHSDDDTVN
jgi:hypothetical protein